MRLKSIALASAIIAIAMSNPAALAQEIRLFAAGPLRERASTRIVLWKGDRPHGQYVIQFGRPVWKKDYGGDQLGQLTRGKIWRLGNNFWTTLDTGMKLRIGDAEVPAGYYYLAVWRSQDGEAWELLLIDPKECRERRLDAYEVETLPGQVPILSRAALKFENVEDSQERLVIRLAPVEGSPTRAALQIRWGNLKLAADIAALPE